MEWLFGVGIAVVFFGTWLVLRVRRRKGLALAKEFAEISASSVPAPAHPLEEMLLTGGSAPSAESAVPATSSSTGDSDAAGEATEDERRAWRDLHARLVSMNTNFFDADIRHRAGWHFRVVPVGKAYVVCRTRKLPGAQTQRILCVGPRQPVLFAHMPFGTALTPEAVRDTSTAGTARLSTAACRELIDQLAGVYKVGN